MASQNYHKRRTKERKARQAEARRVDRLRHRVMRFAGMYAERVARMSVNELEWRDKSNSRVRMVTPMDGLALAMAAMSHSPKMFVRDGKAVSFENL